jgi:hypothetical protein
MRSTSVAECLWYAGLKSERTSASIPKVATVHEYGLVERVLATPMPLHQKMSLME